ncbi:hypothetical protein [Streptomyces sp. NRRL F-2580]|uniref:hypothetical protein n=1 Tax=Streptomyces sp. NRRL F-2580 TaxID=1463841 RepID=UPI00099C20F0|nr:hypothetical protein [Streptomyces sp. NRRL F-2580]
MTRRAQASASPGPGCSRPSISRAGPGPELRQPFPLGGNTPSRPRPPRASRLPHPTHTPPQPGGPRAERPAPARGRSDPVGRAATELPVRPLTELYEGIGARDAYGIQLLNIRRRCAEGAAVTGHKVNEADPAEGYVLACQALPLGPAVRITYG